MKRSEFIKLCASAGLGAAIFPSLLTSCKEDTILFGDLPVNFSGKVLIIGAGSAGLTAGHVLQQHGVDFEILEASSVFGGRVKKVADFADFPIDLGAEWIHTDPSVLATLINDPSVNADVEIINYAPETMYFYNNDKLRKRNFLTNFYSEYKFKNTTWFDFFEQFIVPGISDKIVYNSPVREINYTSSTIQVTNTNDEVFTADKVILTVPLTILQNDAITFTPAMPGDKRSAFDDVDMPDGIKVFLEFSERFYPDITVDGSLSEFLNDDNGEKIYYDAAFRKDSTKNIMGLFTVGEPASIYANQPSEEALISYILDELDTFFDGEASKNYIGHVIQNWSAETYIQGSYSQGFDGSTQEIISEPIDNKIFFAGEAYADDYATVHGAGLSAYTVVEEILQGNS